MAGLLDFLDDIDTSSTAGLGHEQYGAGAPVSDVVGNIGAWMAENKANHPIYSGVGKNLGEDVLYDKVDAITGEVRDSPNVTNIPLLPEGTFESLMSSSPEPQETDLFKYISAASPLEGESQEDAGVKGIILDSSAKKKFEQGLSTPFMDLLLEAEPNPSAEAVAAANSKDLKQHTEQQLKQSGSWNEGVAKAWDNFNDMYDLTTIGLNLMATNGNGNHLMSNLGLAMMEGRNVRIAQQQQEAASKAAGRKEARDERGLQVKEGELVVKGEDSRTKRMTAIANLAGAERSPSPETVNQMHLFVANNPEYKGILKDQPQSTRDALVENAAMYYDIARNDPRNVGLDDMVVRQKALEMAAREGQWEKMNTMWGFGSPAFQR